jgi:hypothetical protein
LRAVDSQLCEDINPGDVRQSVVNHRDLRIPLLRQTKALLAGTCTNELVPVKREKSANRLSNERVVLDEQNSRHRMAPFVWHSAGTRSDGVRILEASTANDTLRFNVHARESAS